MRGLIKFLSIMVILTGLYYARHYLVYRQMEKNSLSFVTDSVNTILENWNVTELEKAADTTLKSGGAIKTTFDRYRKLGSLVTPANCELDDFTSYKYPGTSANYIAATYECHAVFQNGPATIQLIILRYRDTDEWKIFSFDVISPYLTMPKKN